jgi:hypothetical protein
MIWVERMKHLCAAVCIAATAAACGLNESGNLSSTKQGDTSRLAERRSPLDELRANCGAGAPTSAGLAALKRRPYLQRMGSTMATIGWVTRDADGALVALETPEGGAGVMNARVDEVKVRMPGENQMWATSDELQPATIYCYSLADASGPLTTPTGFRTAPALESDAPVRFLAFGDSGGGGFDQHALRDQMYTVPYDLMIHTGDIAYDSGTISELESNVFRIYEDLFRNIPIFPAAGNHEYETMQGAPFRDVFDLPGQEKWYSFDWGSVHFAALDTEASYSTQAAWLDKDLSETDRPWKVVYMHRPPYSSGQHGSDTSLRRALAPVLKRHGVQLVLAGHDHDYERIAPQDGTHYIVTGGGGVGTRPVGTSSFTVLSEDVIHFVYGEVHSNEMVLHAIDATGREFDSVVIPRE